MLEFEYDPDKSESNFRRHGVDLEGAQRLWDVDHVEFYVGDVRGEARRALVGMLDERLYVAIFAWRGSNVRLISCHRASGKWERAYGEKIVRRN
mgnify:CR=1 FL=1